MAVHAELGCSRERRCPDSHCYLSTGALAGASFLTSFPVGFRRFSAECPIRGHAQPMLAPGAGQETAKSEAPPSAHEGTRRSISQQAASANWHEPFRSAEKPKVSGGSCPSLSGTLGVI